MAQIIRKLKKRSKSKGNLPLIYFNFGKIRHFYAKFPFKKDSDDEEEPRKRVFKEYPKKNILYSKEKNDFSEEEEYVSNDDRREILYLATN